MGGDGKEVPEVSGSLVAQPKNWEMPFLGSLGQSFPALTRLRF